MKTYKKLSLMAITFGLLVAVEQNGQPSSADRDRDDYWWSCGYFHIYSCDNDTECYPASWLNNGICNPELDCYENDGHDCDYETTGDEFIDDCSLCESMNNDMTCYDLLGQWMNCFDCLEVYDCNNICMGPGEEDECGVCEGNGPEENFDCDGNCTAGFDCNDVCGGDALEDECGVCNGGGIPEGECDCVGSVIDECGICGGDGNWCFPPEAHSATHTLTEDSMIDIGLLASDPDGDVLTFSFVSNPTSGIAELNGNTATYMPDVNFYGEDSFDFIVSDGVFESNIATINLVVVPVNDAPFWVFLPEEEEIVVGEIVVYVLEAEDVDGDELFYQLMNVTGPGTATLAGEILTVQATEEGEIEITASVSDGAMTDEETFTLIVLSPECADEYEQGFFDGSATGDVNGDGVLNVTDIVQSVNMILNGE